MNPPHTFEPGSTYWYTFPGDQDLREHLRVSRRSPSNVWDSNGKRHKVYRNHITNSEYVMPDGKYSKCPICRSDNVV